MKVLWSSEIWELCNQWHSNVSQKPWIFIFNDFYQMQNFALNGIKQKEISIAAMLPLHKSIYL